MAKRKATAPAIPPVPDDLLPAARALARSAAFLGHCVAALGGGMTTAELLSDPARVEALHAANLTVAAWCQAVGIDD